MSDKYGYIGIETLLNFCSNQKDHCITPNDFMRMNRVKIPERQHGEWIPVTFRPMDEEEYEEYRKEFGEIPIEDRKIFSCPMPDDDQEILICTSCGGVSQDRCEIDEYGYALEAQGDWDGVIAWMELPKPYEKEGDQNG